MKSRARLKLTAAVAVVTALAAGTALGHPDPQPLDGTPDEPGLDWTLEVVDGGMTSVYQTPTSLFDEVNPFTTSSPTNLLPTLYEPLTDSGGDIIPNTLPSTPEHPYNLHPDPQVSEIDPRSPRWDLGMILAELRQAAYPDVQRNLAKHYFANGEGVPADPRRGRVERMAPDAGKIAGADVKKINYDRVKFAIDILEGNPIDRTYSGMALLHYKGPDMVKTVDPDTNTVTVHQSWQHARIMSDTMFVDPSTIPDDETWTMRFVVDCLFWGEEDFAPFATFFDDPRDVGVSRANVAMDQSFFPMQPGHRYVFDIKMPPHRYWNLTYNWGWRQHAPRIQAIEKATKAPGGKNIVQWESDVFGEHPTASEDAKMQAISMLSDLAPAKRMWLAFRALYEKRNKLSTGEIRDLVEEASAAYDDWKDRLKLPRGIEPAGGDYDETIVYLNNTMYGGIMGLANRSQPVWENWETRGATLKVKLLNGDYFPHMYMNVDFGGRRGWENIYQNTIPLGGQGPLFTFGRAYFFPNLKAPAQVPAASREATKVATSGGIDLRHFEGTKIPRRVEPIAAPVLRKELARAGHKAGLDSASLSGASRELPEVAKAMESDYDPIETQVGMKFGPVVTKLAQTSAGLGEHNVIIHYRFEPSRRLRFYQFDPFHHNEDILSVH